MKTSHKLSSSPEGPGSQVTIGGKSKRRNSPSRNSTDRFYACLKEAQSAQAAQQFPAALKLFRRCVKLGKTLKETIPRLRTQIQSDIAIAELRYAEMLIFCGAISRGIELGFRTVRRLNNEASINTSAEVSYEQGRVNQIFSQHRRKLYDRPLWILFPKLYEAILHILTNHDPRHVVYYDKSDVMMEYSHELDVILPRLKGACSERDVERVVRHVFGYSSRSRSAVPRAIADEIWQCIRRPKHRAALPAVIDVGGTISRVIEQIQKLRPKRDEKLRLALIAALRNEVAELEDEPMMHKFFAKLARAGISLE